MVCGERGRGGGQGVSECGRAFRILSRVKTMAFRGDTRESNHRHSFPLFFPREGQPTITAREGGDSTYSQWPRGGEKGSGRQLSLGLNNTGAYPGGGRVGLKPSKKISTSEYNNFFKKGLCRPQKSFFTVPSPPQSYFLGTPLQQTPFLIPSPLLLHFP